MTTPNIAVLEEMAALLETDASIAENFNMTEWQIVDLPGPNEEHECDTAGCAIGLCYIKLPSLRATGLKMREYTRDRLRSGRWRVWYEPAYKQPDGTGPTYCKTDAVAMALGIPQYMATNLFNPATYHGDEDDHGNVIITPADVAKRIRNAVALLKERTNE